MGWRDDPVATPSQGGWQADPVVSKSSASNFWGDQLHGLGVGARDIIEGVLTLPKMGANAVAATGNLALKGADLASGGGVPYRLPYQGEAVSDLLGLPRPASNSERIISNVGRSVTGTLGSLGTGMAVGGPIGNALAAQPVTQIAGAVTGPVAAEATRAAGGGPVAQTVANVVGSAAPSLLGSAVPALTKRLLRGSSSPQDVQANIDAFNQAGASPSAGQATEGRFSRSAESMLSRTPGGAGVMTASAQTQASDLGGRIEDIASSISSKSSAEQAGRAIEKGISGEGGFIDKFKATQGQLYDKLDNFIPQNQPIGVNNTQNALKALNADIPGAPAVSELFKNAKIKGIDRALTSDVQGNQVGNQPAVKFLDELFGEAGLNTSVALPSVLPYQAVKKLRTLVGDQLSDWTITSDVPRSKWKTLYGALTQDLKGAAQDAGPGAMQAWNRANTFTRAGMSRIDVLNSVVNRYGGPEQIFNAAMSGTKEGATTLRSVMQSLPADGQKMLSATVLRRLGSATPGQQTDMGTKFSTETFLTNWNRLSPEAKVSLFDRYGPGFRAAMDNVAKVAANLRSGSKVWQNPSGTGQAVAQVSAATTIIGSLLTGHLWIAASGAGAVGGANLSARLMTNPNFVRWLATTTRMPTGAVPSALNALAQQGVKSNDQDLVDAATALNQAANH